MSSFEAVKGPTEIHDFALNYGVEFAKDDPSDSISTSSWAVTRGEVVIDSDRVEGDRAIARVSGGTKFHSLHEIQNTVIAASGQRYVRTILIELYNS